MGQRVELVFPKRAVASDPPGGVLHRSGGEAAAVDAAVDFASQEAGGFEDAEMFGDGRKRNLERRGELGDARFPAGEADENGAAGGVGEGAEGGVKGGGEGIVNHTV